jgi:ankyrin repeat protein
LTPTRLLLSSILFICCWGNTLLISHAETVKSKQAEILSGLSIDWQNWLVALRKNSNAVKELVSKNEKWRDLRGSGPFAGMTTVMLAAKFGNLKQFNLILEKKPDLSIQDELGKTVLHHLLERKGVYTKHLKNLIEARAPINHRDINLNTPLHLAAEKEGIESLELLIQHGGYLEAMNLTGKSPLMIAAAIGKEANVKFLISSGADPLVESDSGFNTWMYAAKGGHENILKFLIQNSSIQVEYTEKIHLRTALLLSAIKGDLDTIKYLISLGLNVNQGDRIEVTPLHLAVVSQKAEPVDLLLNNGASAYLYSNSGVTPLDLAVLSGNLPILKLLLKHPPDVPLATSARESALREAAFQGKINLVKELVQQNIAPHTKNINGQTAWMMAVSAGHNEIADYLASQPGPQAVNIIFATEFGFNERLSVLLKENVDINVSDVRGFSPLMLAASRGDVEMLSSLIRYGAKTNHQSLRGWNVLSLAISGGSLETIKKILQVDSKLLLQVDKEGWNALHWAAFHGDLEIINLLLPFFNDVDFKDHQQRTPLQIAAIEGHQRIVKTLLAWKASASSKDQSGRTVLEQAILYRQKDVLENLLVVGIAASAGLRYASSIGEVRLLPLFEKYGANLDASDDDGNTPLLLAIIGEHFETVSSLLESGADPNLANTQGLSPLILAIRSHQPRLTSILLEQPLDLERQDPFGNTPLLIAVLNGNEQIIDQLIIAGAKLEHLNYMGQNALHLAAIQGQVNIVKKFIDAKLSPINPDQFGLTALHRAAENGHAGVVRIFLEAKTVDPNTNVLDAHGDGGTPWILAAKRGHINVLEALLEASADPDAVELLNGTTALQAASSEGQQSTVRWLLEKNLSKIDETDFFGNTALHHAIQKRQELVVQELMRWGANSQKANFDGKSPSESAQILSDKTKLHTRN